MLLFNSLLQKLTSYCCKIIFGLVLKLLFNALSNSNLFHGSDPFGLRSDVQILIHLSKYIYNYILAYGMKDSEVTTTVEVLTECFRNNEDNVELLEQICFALNAYVTTNGMI